MRVSKSLTFMMIDYVAESLLNILQTAMFRQLNVSKDKWKSLVSNPFLQHDCNKGGFNVDLGSVKLRIGIISADRNDCSSPKSCIGFGIEATGHNCSSLRSSGSCGNAVGCVGNNENRLTKAFGLILVR